jgi:hypothetical protein
MSKGNKGNQPEHNFAELAKRVLRTSVYTQRTLKEHLHRDSYITVFNQRSCAQYIMCGEGFPDSSAPPFQRMDVSAHGHFSAWTFQRGSP